MQKWKTAIDMQYLLFIPTIIFFFMLKPYIFWLSFFFLIKEKFKFFYQRIYNNLMIKKCRCGNQQFDIHLWWIWSVHFLSKFEKDASDEWRDGWKKCLFPAEVGISALIFIHASTFAYFYLDLAYGQSCFPPRWRYK